MSFFSHSKPLLTYRFECHHILWCRQTKTLNKITLNKNTILLTKYSIRTKWFMELNRKLSGEKKKKSIFLFCYAITIIVSSRNRLFVPVDHLQCCCCRTTLVVQVHASLCVQAERTVTAVNMSFWKAQWGLSKVLRADYIYLFILSFGL